MFISFYVVAAPVGMYLLLRTELKVTGFIIGIIIGLIVIVVLQIIYFLVLDWSRVALEVNFKH
jgi:Na+-driven multidrug efflux pump